MKQIKRIITKDTLPALFTMLAKRFESKNEPLYITISPPPKTHEQLGYLHSEVLPVFTQVMFDAGELSKLSESEAKYYLKVLCGFGEWVNFRSGLVFNPHSFEGATTEQLSNVIDTAIAECAKRDVYVKPPRRNNENRQST